MKAEARPSQDPEVCPTHSLLLASLYVIPDACPALSPALEGCNLEQSKASLGPACRDTHGGQLPYHESLSCRAHGEF